MSYCFGRLYLPVQRNNSFASSFSTQTVNAHTNAALHGPVRFASMRAFFLAVLLGRPIRLYLRSEEPELSRRSSYQPVRPLDRTAGGVESRLCYRLVQYRTRAYFYLLTSGHYLKL